jgi:pseudouridine-5'-phosphate glycosidase
LATVFSVREDVATALSSGAPVVALESTVIAHGLPWPHNLDTARKMESAVRSEGAVPATIAVLEGRMVVGLSSEQLTSFAEAERVVKVSRADLGAVLASRETGATTVAGTMLIAARAGIRMLATGGIGGVHRGAELSFDISTDLTELARTPVAVVCAGAKAILDLPRTLEALETLGVPVVGYRTSEFPAFYVRESGLPLNARVDTPEEAASLMNAHWGTGLSSGIVFCNPPRADCALKKQEVEALIGRALNSAAAAGIRGNGVTPICWIICRKRAREGRWKRISHCSCTTRALRLKLRRRTARSDLLEVVRHPPKLLPPSPLFTVRHPPKNGFALFPRFDSDYAADSAHDLAGPPRKVTNGQFRPIPSTPAAADSRSWRGGGLNHLSDYAGVFICQHKLYREK